MKHLTFMIFLVIPLAAIAQDYPGMRGANMENMMQQMDRMQTCMEQVDQARMDALQKRSQQVDAEIRSLCARGERDKAQEKAVAFGREMATDPTVQQIRDCGQQVQGMLPGMGFMQEHDYSTTHVCDRK